MSLVELEISVVPIASLKRNLYVLMLRVEARNLHTDLVYLACLVHDYRPPLAWHEVCIYIREDE